ncbi:ABC transporter substrate-binding protein [Marivita hallyeonensis]|uniref:Putative thiamine transport system substrate-binding protein n=1 Tax=Marivita hallyeonensis TaxID=996342 RepID=A0A1M5UR04_9RHOB|nr:ABC transporter substrate-binding protein [Marivita hallyeonensis]SHH65409.1 putative thiamine transport system substrate-binding protein [Marivita hallyeonensis]
MRTFLAAALASFTAFAAVANPDPANWDAVTEEARGQTVYWNAWGGSDTINSFIGWIGDRVQEEYGVTLEHVKLSDTAEAVSRVVAEKSAGKDDGGAVDMIWINGENFAAMKRQGLLFGPWVEQMPSWANVDVAGKPAVVSDFTVPTDGLEAPWGMAQVVFYYDTARLEAPPKSMEALAAYAAENPGRFTYPQPPNFLGSTFLKQALIEFVPDASVLQAPIDEADYSAATAEFWAFLENLTPNLWRAGRAYPQNESRQIQLMADGEIDLAISFNPNEASNAIANFELQDSVRTFVMDAGSIGNASFVAIPYNANAKEGAMVVANFIMSPEAQAMMQDPEVWGLGTVLDLEKLSDDDRMLFDALELGLATLPPDELGATLPEPHPSWMVRLEEDWTERFGVAQ